MARLSQDEAVVDARIVYWGIEGSGKTTNLQVVYRKLRPDHRGELEATPTRIDPTVSYEVLPIELGEVAGLRTRIQMIAVPGAPDQAPTRKQLLDQVDGIVLVIDSQKERLDENAASLDELRAALSDYGRRLEDVPLVIQYNKRELSDPFTLEELYRRLDVPGAAVFEAVAAETTGVLQTLSTLSKRVVRTLRDQQFDVDDEAPAPAAVAAEPDAVAEIETVAPIETPAFDDAPPTVIDFGPPDAPPDDEPQTALLMEDAILAEAEHPDVDAIVDVAASAENLLDASWEKISNEYQSAAEEDENEALLDEPIVSPDDDPAAGPRLGPELSISSVGQATRSGERGVRVPLVIADKEGRSATLVLKIQLDPLLDEDG